MDRQTQFIWYCLSNWYTKPEARGIAHRNSSTDKCKGTSRNPAIRSYLSVFIFKKERLFLCYSVFFRFIGKEKGGWINRQDENLFLFYAPNLCPIYCWRTVNAVDGETPLPPELRCPSLCVRETLVFHPSQNTLRVSTKKLFKRFDILICLQHTFRQNLFSDRVAETLHFRTFVLN